MEACATCRRVRGTTPWMLVKSRMVISPRFMCHPVPSGRGPLTDAARGQIPAYRFWLVPSDTHRQSASSWKLP